tara:strand:- start:5662 stop:6033 length:372 start_codon:yes stop_codon:yes gene_type:complete
MSKSNFFVVKKWLYCILPILKHRNKSMQEELNMTNGQLAGYLNARELKSIDEIREMLPVESINAMIVQTRNDSQLMWVNMMNVMAKLRDQPGYAEMVERNSLKPDSWKQKLNNWIAGWLVDGK